LLEGDAERPAERRVVEEHPEAMLLKVAHHGSASGTSADLLATVHPRYAVISVGARNVYGHPRREVLERLQHAGVKTYRTDEEGAVSFYLDGKSVTPDVALLHWCRDGLTRSTISGILTRRGLPSRHRGRQIAVGVDNLFRLRRVFFAHQNHRPTTPGNASCTASMDFRSEFNPGSIPASPAPRWLRFPARCRKS
jgi:hypothetical protein